MYIICITITNRIAISASVTPLLNKLNVIFRNEISSISFSAHFGIYIVLLTSVK